ncbi:MAG: HD domain-containing protein [Candidatus Adiutrix sp.]|jgi:3'-5' exoribonuclease|nr:HD domain-containing protein [Candidatus Adiutrix sp.]
MATAKHVFVKDLEIGREGEAPFLVESLGRGRTNRGGLYLNVELADRSGRIAAKVWDAAEALAPKLAEGTVVLVRGYVDSYRSAPQFIIREARPLAPDEIHWPDYLKAAPRPLEEMKAELWILVESIPDDDFRRLVSAALRWPDLGELFYGLPAAKSLHHAYLHGLLEHSLSVGRLAAGVAAHYPKLNAALLTAGAILHDLGKVWEFTPPPKVDYSSPGRLKGHLVMGSEFLGRLAESLPGFPTEKLLLLQHLILSHHGEPEYGAPVRPQLLEAMVLHHLDNLDAKMEAIDSFIKAESNEEGWSAYHRLFGSHYRRTPDFPAPPAESQEPEKPLARSEGEGAEDEAPPEAAEKDPADEENPQGEGRLF